MSGRIARTAAEAQAHSAVLGERARRLAQRAPAAPSRDLVQALAFSLADRRFLVDLRFVCEARPVPALLPVPLTRAPLLGLCPLRDRVLPILDLAQFLECDTEARAPVRFIVALGHGLPSLGLPASAVHGVEPLAADEAQARTAPLQGLHSEFVRGRTAAGSLWLDGARLLSLSPVS